MIRYALRCTAEHRFEAWFASSAEFDRLAASGLVTCAVCGRVEIAKDLMAPAVSAERRDQEASQPNLSASEAAQSLRALRRKIEASAENVGRGFASEARRIHAGEAPERPIWGEAPLPEAKALVEDGIPVIPLPFPSRKAN
jgi:hypothetical protein